MLEPQDTLDPELASLYATERAAPLPDGATTRVLAGVLAAVTASTVATGATSAAAGASSSAASSATTAATSTATTAATSTAISAGGAGATGIAVGKVVAIAVASAIGGGAVGVVSYRELAAPPAVRKAAPPREPAPRPDVVAPAAVVDAPPPIVDAPSAPVDAAPARPVKRDPVVEPGADTREPLLIDQARAALRRGLVDQAVETLMRHERLHPKGDLAEERDVLIIEAYVAKSDATLAKRRIERYRRDHPTGFLKARVDRAETTLASP